MGILVIRCNRDSRFMVWKLVEEDYDTNSVILVLLEPITPMLMPTRYLGHCSRLRFDMVRA